VPESLIRRRPALLKQDTKSLPFIRRVNSLCVDINNLLLQGANLLSQRNNPTRRALKWIEGPRKL
jgi:hypothetical protein